MNVITRKQQVINRLLEAGGEWVDGTDLASAECGGSEGLKRLREARAEGWPIEERKHPDRRRSIWQYRIARGSVLPGPEGLNRQTRRPASVSTTPRPASSSANSTVEPTMPLRGNDASPPAKYRCPKPGCGQTLNAVADHPFVGTMIEGRCYSHGRQAVPK